MENAEKVFGNAVPLAGVRLNYGLKEWSSAIGALLTGELIFLLRKGGIADPARPFANLRKQFALFPTYEHQAAQALKAEYLAEDRGAESGIVLRAWAQVTHGFTLDSFPAVQALLPFHIWTPDFIAERFRWRPQQPLQILCLRAYSLQSPVSLQDAPQYSGCRSWIELEFPVLAGTLRPALSNAQYVARLNAIEAALNTHSDFDLSNFEL